MKKILLTLSLCALSPVSFAQTASTAPAPGRPISLDEAFKLALAKSEVLAAQGQGVVQLAAFERQVRSFFLPTFDFNATHSRAQKQDNKTQYAITGGFLVFNGMRDYIALKSADLKTEAARLQLARARQVFYTDTALAYITLTNVVQELSVRRDQLNVSANRIKELQSRERIGRSRTSEVVAARAQLAQDEADFQNALSRENLAQLQLRFLTGLDENLAPQLLTLPDNSSIEPYLAGIGNRFDVRAARKSLDAAGSDADIAKKYYWPSLDLTGDYYLKRPTANKATHWDWNLALNLPLFTGGFSGSVADQAKARQASADLALKLTVRQADTDVRQAYSILTHSLAILESLKNALTLSEENAADQAKDYTYGLVTNLDVLNAQNLLLQTKLKLEQARAEAGLAGIQLEVAGGGPAFIVEEK